MSRTLRHTRKSETSIKKNIHRQYNEKSRSYFKTFCKKVIQDPEIEENPPKKVKEIQFSDRWNFD